MSLANFLMDLKEAKSSGLYTTFLLSVALIISSAAFCPLVGSRQAKITFAPRFAKSSAVSYPIPGMVISNHYLSILSIIGGVP